MKIGISWCLGLLMCWSIQAEANLNTVKITDQVYALVGPMEQRSAPNLGNNATFGFIVTANGVVLIDSGGTAQGAAQIAAAIAKVTDQPIRWVINTGGQDHRWFGNRYFQQRGATSITSAKTFTDQTARLREQSEKMAGFTGEAVWAGTEPTPAQSQFSGEKQLKVAGIRLQLIELGPAHTGGETAVWLPQQQILFSGDVIYVERMLGIGGQSQHQAWIEAFERLALLKPHVIVPGHGAPTDLATAEQDTLSYLRFLRKAVGELIDEGGEMQDLSQIDQSKFSYLQVYEQIHQRNAQRVFTEMEWE